MINSQGESRLLGFVTASLNATLLSVKRCMAPLVVISPFSTMMPSPIPVTVYSSLLRNFFPLLWKFLVREIWASKKQIQFLENQFSGLKKELKDLIEILSIYLAS